MSTTKKLRILIPLDGSIPGNSSLMAIQSLIRTGPVECTLLHVVEPQERIEGMEAMMEVHREILKSLGVPTQIRIDTGKPSEVILRYAANGDCDLVVMSTHGRRGMDRVLLGSVAEEVVRSSPVPTLLNRMGTFSESWENIVVALNGTPGAEEILDEVLVLARRLRATVHLLQVGLNLLRANSYRGVTFESPVDESFSYLDDIAARFKGEGIEVTTERRSGMAAVEIARFAKHVGAALICMTTEGRPETIPGLNPSVAAEVIRQAPCPVYVKHMRGASCGQR